MIDYRSNGFVLIVCAILWVVLGARFLINSATTEREYVPPKASQQAIESFVRSQLDSLQARSFAEGIELCGFVFEDENGNLDTTEVYVGETASCSYDYRWPLDVRPVAGYHTHGGYNPQYDDEAPSIFDMEQDIEFRIDGYVSTPGGRFWRVDWQNERAIQICGEGCLAQDPKYRPCPADRPVMQYSLAELRTRITVAEANC
ncbi:MAG: DUF4329 domain-containing protein [Erythrobacter sp.]|nr:DUF4329 domain-containing protein [Erythrobacter sp.]